jgi:hypothetical protein
VGRVIDLRSDPYVRAVLREHPERDTSPPEPAPPVEPAIPTIPTRDIALEREQRIDTLCAELEALCVVSDPFLGVKIAKAVARAHGITWQEFISKRRHAHITKARQHAMWEIRENTSLSLPLIGKILGGLDHTTIIYGIRQHARRLRGERK